MAGDIDSVAAVKYLHLGIFIKDFDGLVVVGRALLVDEVYGLLEGDGGRGEGLGDGDKLAVVTQIGPEATYGGGDGFAFILAYLAGQVKEFQSL